MVHNVVTENELLDERIESRIHVGGRPARPKDQDALSDDDDGRLTNQLAGDETVTTMDVYGHKASLHYSVDHPP